MLGFMPVALPSGVRFLPGPVNGPLVNGRVLVYGDTGGRVKEASHVLFTHARRDVVWAGTALVRDGSAAVVPGSGSARCLRIRRRFGSRTGAGASMIIRR